MMKRTLKQEERFAHLASLIGLSVLSAEELCRAAEKTCNQIAYDSLQGNGEDMTGDHVVEVVMDADYIRIFNPGLSAVVNEVLRQYECSENIAIMLREFVFPYKYYGI
jgi:hypothetical protein